MTTLMGALLFSALMIGMGLVAERCLRRFDPRRRSLVCRVTLIVLALCAPLLTILSLCLPASRALENVPPYLQHTTALPVLAPFFAPGGALATEKMRNPLGGKEWTPIRSGGPVFSSVRPTIIFPKRQKRSSALPQTVARVLPPVYGLGVVVSLCWLTLAYQGSVRLRRRALPVETPLDFPAAVRISPDVQNVILAGVRRPVLLLPADFFARFDGEMRRAILRHECAHLVRRDALWNVLFRAVEALLWPLPFVRRLRLRHEDASEEIADQAAVRGAGIAPRRYAKNLLALCVSPAASPCRLSLGISSPPSRIGARIERLLLLRRIPGRPLSPRASAGIFALAFGVALPLALGGAQVFAARRQESGWNTDARLRRAVTISAEGIALSDLLARLSQEAGVTFAAGRAVGEEKVVLFSRSRPLGDTLADVAALFHYAWRETKDEQGRPAYRLEATDQVRRFEQRLAREDGGWILGQLDTLVRALKETPEQIKKRAPDDPVRRTLEGSRLAVELYARLTPEQRAVLVETGRVRLAVARLTPAQKTALAPMFYEGERFKEQPEVVQGGDGTLSLNGLTPIGPEKMDRTSLAFEMTVSEGGEESGQMSVFMRAPTGLGITIASFPAPAAFGLPVRGNPYDGTPVSENDLPADQMSLNGALVDRLKSLAEKSGRPVVADFYRSRPIHIGSPGEIREAGTPAGNLDALCTNEGYLWWTQQGGHGKTDDKTFFFRKRDWYRQKQYEVSDAWRLAAANRLRARRGNFVVADLLPLTQLTLDQIVGLQSGSGATAGRRNLGGLPQALQMVGRVAPVGASIAVVPDKNIWSHTLLVSPDDPRVEPLLAAFLDRYNYPDILLDADPAQFGFLVGGRLDAMKKVVSFDMDIQTQAGSRVIGYHFNVPLELPNDRRDRTRISVP